MIQTEIKEVAGMQLRKAKDTDLTTVYDIVQETIRCDYPNYYPTEVVNFFLEYHNEDSIRKDIGSGDVYLLFYGGTAAGTGTIKNQTIERIYILPKYQGKGFGTSIMDLLENEITAGFDFSNVEASLVSYDFYLHRGYRPTEYHKYKVENNRVLCYYVMEKPLRPGKE